jgi:hypothetical protein
MKIIREYVSTKTREGEQIRLILAKSQTRYHLIEMSKYRGVEWNKDNQTNSVDRYELENLLKDIMILEEEHKAVEFTRVI